MNLYLTINQVTPAQPVAPVEDVTPTVEQPVQEPKIITDYNKQYDPVMPQAQTGPM